MPDIDDISEAVLQNQYEEVVSTVNKRPENQRYEALAREDRMQPGAPVVFKASKLSENHTYSASSMGYAWILSTFEGLLGGNGSAFKLEDSDVIVEFGAGTGLFPKVRMVQPPFLVLTSLTTSTNQPPTNHQPTPIALSSFAPTLGMPRTSLPGTWTPSVTFRRFTCAAPGTT